MFKFITTPERQWEDFWIRIDKANDNEDRNEIIYEKALLREGYSSGGLMGVAVSMLYARLLSLQNTRQNEEEKDEERARGKNTRKEHEERTQGKSTKSTAKTARRGAEVRCLSIAQKFKVSIRLLNGRP